ncbi:MAG: type I restriction endonuclease subunit R [Candidatus Gracilibacteria bacterium]|nr:type I restriction endonuclease subunit R [Candidatus Gracilibacteria bacterium]
MKFTENSLETAIIELLEKGGYPHINGSHIHKEISDVLMTDDLRNYLLAKYTRDDITLNEIKSIIRKLELYPSSSLYDSNKAIIKLISDGFIFKREDRTKKDLFIQLVDFENLENNSFKFVNQMEIMGSEKRIPDGIVYINGIPLVVFEFKSSIKENATIRDAYTQLTVRYKRDIPELFKYNAFCVISDGINNKMGSLFAPYDFFYAWRKTDINSKPSDGIDSLFTMIEGLFDKSRLLEVIKDFVYFPDGSKSDLKIVCRYPQFYAAKKLFENILINKKPDGNGKGGTYFGATGSGKSYTMLYLTRLLMKSISLSSPTIVIITDRVDLDDQLSTQFGESKDYIGDENIISVESREDLKNYLKGRNSGGVFLTTIHKFTESTDLLSERDNIICISDEAHRSQVNLDKKLKISDKGVTHSYGFAKYLHDSLPNATYVGFTGTPIDATLEVFGPVIDMYTMKESVEDNITVRIVYEGRAAKVLLDNTKLRQIEDYYKKCEDNGANEYQIEESKRATTNMESILGDPQVIKTLASDFVEHYEKRIEEGATVLGKVMFVCPSRPIAHSFYREVLSLRPEWGKIKECYDGVELSEKDRKEIKPIEKIKLIMTRGKDDNKELYNDIGAKENIKEYDRQFKNKKSNFKIAIVVDMWLTGFDVPFLDTIYIFKPLQQHSLIQTISRVNRVYEGKESGLVVDYIGIKSNMNIALKKYSDVDGSDFEDIGKAVTVVKDQLDLLNKLFVNFDSSKYFSGTPLEKLNNLNKAVEFIQITESIEKRFMGLVKKLRSAFNLSCSNEEINDTERDQIHFYFAIKSILHKLTKGEAPDVSQMNEKVREMIQEAIISEGIEEIFKLGDESETKLDIFSDEYLAKIDKIKLPNTKIKLLQQLLSKAIQEYKKTNKIKGIDFSKRLQKIVDSYNERKEDLVFAGEVLDDVAHQFANLFHELKKDMNSFKDLGINFEEKAFYDILKDIAKKHGFEYPEDKLIILSKAVKTVVDDKTKYTDWDQKDDIKAELKVDLILILAENDYPPVTKDEVFKEIFEQAENFKKYN